MKEKIKRYFSHEMAVQKILFGVYLYFVTSISLFLGICYKGNTIENEVLITCLIFAIPAICAATWLVFKYFPNISITKKSRLNKKQWAMIFCGVTIASFLIFMIYYLVFCPARLDYDCKEQLELAISQTHLDWHPFLQTFLVYEIPILIFGNVAGIVLLQMVFFALAVGFLVTTIYEYSNKFFAIASLLLILLNPNTGYIAVTPWKDSSFTIVLIIAFTCVFRLCINSSKVNACLKDKKGAEICWKQIVMSIFGGLMLALAISFRQNGIVLAIVLLALIIFNSNKKIWISCLSVFLICVIAINGPLAQALNVERVQTPVRRELFGAMVSAMGNVNRCQPESLDPQVKDIVDKMAQPEVWEQYSGCEDVIYMIFGNTLYRNKGLWSDSFILVDDSEKNLDIFLKTIQSAPKAAIYGILFISNFIYAFDPGSLSGLSHTEEVDFSGNQTAKEIIEGYSDIVSPIFGFIGLITLLCVALVLCKCSLKTKTGWKKALLPLSILAYNFASVPFMIRHEYRYFYFEFVVIFIVLLFMLYKKCEITKSNYKKESTSKTNNRSQKKSIWAAESLTVIFLIGILFTGCSANNSSKTFDLERQANDYWSVQEEISGQILSDPNIAWTKSNEDLRYSKTKEFYAGQIKEQEFVPDGGFMTEEYAMHTATKITGVYSKANFIDVKTYKENEDTKSLVKYSIQNKTFTYIFDAKSRTIEYKKLEIAQSE